VLGFSSLAVDCGGILTAGRSGTGTPSGGGCAARIESSQGVEMDASAIIFPAVAMFMLTFSVIAYTAGSRLSAIRSGDVNIRYYRRYTEGEQTPRLQVIGRHAQNQFEIPPLFYIAILFLYVTSSVTPLAVTLAWLYFASRCAHSFIHLGSNNVTHRFIAFAVSGLILASLWILLLLSVASSGAQ
jgi:hypothetical protein